MSTVSYAPLSGRVLFTAWFSQTQSCFNNSKHVGQIERTNLELQWTGLWKHWTMVFILSSPEELEHIGSSKILILLWDTVTQAQKPSSDNSNSSWSPPIRFPKRECLSQLPEATMGTIIAVFSGLLQNSRNHVGSRKKASARQKSTQTNTTAG